MRTATMMTSDNIRTELGWTDSMIHSLLQIPDSPNARHCKNTGGYTYGLYYRDRVLTAMGRDAAWRRAQPRLDHKTRRHRPITGYHSSRRREDT